MLDSPRIRAAGEGNLTDLESIERVGRLDRPFVEDLLQCARAEGFGFLDRLVNDWHSARNRFELRGEALFAVCSGGRAVATCGLNRDPYVADDGTARLRHLYVHPSWRRCGIATRLTLHALGHAAGAPFTRVHLRTDTERAARFYERLGFEPCEDEASATHRLAL